MRIFKTEVFTRFARKAGISNAVLREAVARAGLGLIDADLGGGVLKQRIARPGAGKSGGFRSIIVFRSGERAVFVYGFAKNRTDNISAKELAAFRRLAETLLAPSDDELMLGLGNDTLVEI